MLIQTLNHVNNKEKAPAHNYEDNENQQIDLQYDEHDKNTT